MSTDNLDAEAYVSEMFPKEDGGPIPPDYQLSPEDLNMLLIANNAIKVSLQELGLAARRLESLKVEIATALQKTEAEVSAVSTKVTEAEASFNILAKAMASKYGIDSNQRCNINLATGVFTVA